MITIRAENLQKRYGDHCVLKNISLQISKGEVLSVLGSSGSGKSTLLRCLNLLEIPEEGNLNLSNEEIVFQPTRNLGRMVKDQKQLIRLRSKLSMVFQDFSLWSHMTALENVMEAPYRVLKLSKSEARSRAKFYLEKVGLSSFIDYFPNHLSGGQQQRVGIARALAMEPEVLLFDEPTSALDPELVGEVLRVIQDLAKEGRSMVIVTHEMNFAREVSDRILFLHEGLIEEEGNAEEVFQNPKSEKLKSFLQTLGQ